MTQIQYVQFAEKTFYMTFEGLHNQKICAGEYQPQVTLVKNLNIGIDITSTLGINFPNFQWWEIQDAPVTSP